jgi:methionyl-tRNA formyltransferase
MVPASDVPLSPSPRRGHPPLRLVLMGTGGFAVPTFEMLRDEQLVVAVYSRPAIPAQGRPTRPPGPVRQWAEQHNLKVHGPPTVNDAATIQQLAALAADLLVVCDLHGSLLPKYRGAAPVNWALIEGETETGVTVIHMTPGLDAGPSLVQRKTPVGDNEDAVAVESRLAELGVGAVREALRLLADWNGRSPLGTPQDAAHATRAPRLKKADGEVNWERSAHAILNQVRGLRPWPGTFTAWEPKPGQLQRLIVDQVSLVDATAPSLPPGTVARAEHGQLWVATGDGLLALDRVQPAGKRVMSSDEFLRGHRLEAGRTRFGRGV